jgi:GTP cyclohydrolase III
MKLETTNFRAVAANLVAEGEVCDVAHPDVSTQTETGTEIAPLIQQIGDTSIAEIDRLMAELQEGLCRPAGSLVWVGGSAPASPQA